jgi:hypothetical protein
MWAISGRVNETRVGVESSGYAAMWCAEARSNVRPVTQAYPVDGLLKLRSAETKWRILCGDDAILSQHPEDLADDELMSDVLDLFSAQPHRPAAGIISGEFLEYPAEEASAQFFPEVVVLLPREAFRALWQVFATTLHRPDISYHIVVDWVGFAVEGAETAQLPTWDRFRLGTPFTTRNVVVSVACDSAASAEEEEGGDENDGD